jgi:DNA-binding NarL/FixJ family response regulator
LLASDPPHRHVNVISLDRYRRLELLDRLADDRRYTLASRANRPEALSSVVVLDVAGSAALATEVVRRLSAPAGSPRLLAVVQDEKDIELSAGLVLAGAAGITSLHQPADGIRQAAVDVADGLAALSPALETALVRHLQQSAA